MYDKFVKQELSLTDKLVERGLPLNKIKYCVKTIAKTKMNKTLRSKNVTIIVRHCTRYKRRKRMGNNDKMKRKRLISVLFIENVIVKMPM